MNEDLKTIDKVPPFSRFCMTLGQLPTSYVESMSYYEQLIWLTKYIADNVIPAVNNNAQALEELQDFVVHYFDNLDVQEEINNKLDEMAESGELTQLIGNYVHPLINQQNTIIDEFKTEVNNDLDEMDSKINQVLSGAPLVVSSTSDMTDTTKIYVNSSDGNWYYYNGTAWVSGGTYQATQIDNSNLAIDGRNTKTTNTGYYYGYDKFSPIGNEYTFEYGDVSGSVGSEIVLTSNDFRKRTASPIEVSATEFLTIYNMSSGYVSYRVFIVDSNDVLKWASGWLTGNMTLFNKYHDEVVKYYLLVQITGHYNWDVTANELSKIRVLKTQINRQNYLHGIFDTNVYRIANSGNDLYESTTRCLSDFISYNGKVKIKSIDGYDFLITQYNKSTKAYIHDETSWVSNVLYFTFNPDYYYKIAFRKHNNSTITPSDVIENVKIYPIEQTDSITQYSMPNIILNNHQGYSPSYSYGMDLAKNYYNSFKEGYKYAETDVRFTLDNVPVCCHDASFTSGGQTIVIAETNYEDLEEITYYDGEPVSSLDSVMANCKKYGITLQLDQLDGSWTDTQWTNLFSVINKYQMKDYVMYSAGNQTLITKILTFDEKATCIINVTDLSNLNTLITLASDNKNGKNKFIIAINYTLVTPSELYAINEDLESDIYTGVWTIDSLETALTYVPYAYMITTNKITPSDIINEYI